MFYWPQTTFEFSKFYISISYHHLQRPRCHLHVANRINFFVIFWNGKWEKRIFCTTHGVSAVCTHCHMTGMPWFLSCGSIYATPCQKWLLGLWKRNSAQQPLFASREGISSQKKIPPWHLWRGTLPAGQFGPEGRWRETRVDYFPLWKFSPWIRTWDLMMNKKSTFNKSNMNRKSIQFYT